MQQSDNFSTPNTHRGTLDWTTVKRVLLLCIRFHEGIHRRSVFIFNEKTCSNTLSTLSPSFYIYLYAHDQLRLVIINERISPSRPPLWQYEVGVKNTP